MREMLQFYVSKVSYDQNLKDFSMFKTISNFHYRKGHTTLIFPVDFNINRRLSSGLLHVYSIQRS